MSESSPHRSLLKRILLVIGGIFAFIFIFVVCFRIAVNEMYGGIAQSRATGLSGGEWDLRSMWSSGGLLADFVPIPAYQKGSAASWIARTADLRARSSAFDHSLAALHQVVSAHRGYLEDLRTESRSGHGRALAATISVSSNDFDATLADLKTLGRVEGISEAGEDSVVQLATAARHLVLRPRNNSHKFAARNTL